MSIIAWILLGGVAGWLASIFAGTDASQGLIANIIIGIVGAMVGGFLFNVLGGAGITGFNLYSLLVAIIGSIVLISLSRLVAR
jgi:uncharacterized membrane protein YeaQ/YmgE (transglycosylase-associated protein family)